MRINMFHSEYRSSIPSGENLTVLAIKTLLEDAGNSVNLFSELSDPLINSLQAQFRLMRQIQGNGLETSNFESSLLDADVIQIHNPFPWLTFKQMELINSQKVEITQVVHNYRLTCLKGTHFRDGKSCYKCTLNRNFSGIVLGCYNNSVSKSTFVSNYYRHYRDFIFSSKVKFVAISEHIADYLENEVSIPRDKITVINNSVPDLPMISDTANEVVFLSRLEEEKGVRTVVETWLANQNLPVLNIVGDGSMAEWIRKSIRLAPNIIFHGKLSGKQLDSVMSNSKLLLAPWQWKEPFGRVIAEGLSRGMGIISTPQDIVKFSVLEGINGFVLRESSPNLSELVIAGMKLPIVTQMEYSKRIWRTHFSDDFISKEWGRFYEKI